MKTPFLHLTLGLLGLAACATTSKTTPAASTAASSMPSLAPREDLPQEVRDALTSRMLRHGDQMGALSIAVVLLDYEVVRLITARMIEEPVLGRPTPGDANSLNARLPKSFFIHQDALTHATRGLAVAAEGTDDAKLVSAYSAVANSCVGCHSTYLHDELVLGPEPGLPCEITGACDEEDEPGESRDD